MWKEAELQLTVMEVSIFSDLLLVGDARIQDTTDVWVFLLCSCPSCCYPLSRVLTSSNLSLLTCSMAITVVLLPLGGFVYELDMHRKQRGRYNRYKFIQKMPKTSALFPETHLFLTFPYLYFFHGFSFSIIKTNYIPESCRRNVISPQCGFPKNKAILL